jgi:hypothetical protein
MSTQRRWLILCGSILVCYCVGCGGSGPTVTPPVAVRGTLASAKIDCRNQANKSGLTCDVTIDQNYTHPTEAGAASNGHDDDDVDYHCLCH